MHRTQFDAQLLRESISDQPPVCRNHGRHIAMAADGSTWTALAWGNLLRVWRDRTLVCERTLEGEAGAPCIDAEGRVSISVKGRVIRDEKVIAEGQLHDVADDVLAVGRADGLHLVRGSRDVWIDPEGSAGTLDIDNEGSIHLVYERKWTLEYRRLDAGLNVTASRTLALAFARDPVILAGGGRVIVAYLADHVPVPATDGAFWEGKPQDRRIGLGGHIAAVVMEADGSIARHSLAESKQIAKPLWPKYPTYQYDYPNVNVRVRLECFGPPALVRGGDGVVQVLWTNTTRRWIYASRWLEGSFSPAAEVRGPIETIERHVLAPRRVPGAPGDIPIAMVARSRVYLDRLALAPREVRGARRIDFLQPDDLAVCRGFELHVEKMRKSPHNPVIASPDGSAIAGGVNRLSDGRFVADLLYKVHKGSWRCERPAYSDDGITFDRPGVYPPTEQYLIDGQPFGRDSAHIYHIDEPGTTPRFKGLWQHDPGKAWGTLIPVQSDDGISWTTMKGAPYPVCDGVFIWRDEDDLPERRYKAIGNARSFCGRTCCQWVSADGLHWNDIRDSLDFYDPFGADPYWHEGYADGRGTGRYLVEPWAGPDEEDEIHGGVIVRDGDRWLCHYMKWTYDGHIYSALATSRDGINFTRVGGGATTLPLGEPGTWDSGRIATHTPPCKVDGKWRQYYVGSGWKHGMEGQGKRPHPTSGNVGPFAPNQIGFAEIPIGRWACLRLQREADEAQLVTIPLTLHGRYIFDYDIEGAESVACAAMETDGSMTDLKRGAVIERTEPVRLALRVRGSRAKVYAISLKKK